MPVVEYQPLYNVPETAKILKVNTSFVYGEIKAGRLPVLKLGSYKIRGADLERYIMQYPAVSPEGV